MIRGDVRSVAGLLDKKGWANARDHYGHSPLHKSVMANQEEILQWLIDNYPDHIEDRDNVRKKAFVETVYLNVREAAVQGIAILKTCENLAGPGKVGL